MPSVFVCSVPVERLSHRRPPLVICYDFGKSTTLLKQLVRYNNSQTRLVTPLKYSVQPSGTFRKPDLHFSSASLKCRSMNQAKLKELKKLIATPAPPHLGPQMRAHTESITALENDQAFLLEGDVFTPDVLETWIAMKRSKDIAAVNLRPHPFEFFLYYDA
jgi:hypothetical protein